MTDTMKKIIRTGTGIGKWAMLAATLFIACYEIPDWFYEEGGGTNGGTGGTTFTDSRDGKIYKKVTIGTQTWMAENLNYDVPNVTTDVCYENKAANCGKYGRLYNWSTAMNGASSSSYNPSRVQGVCPTGWHLPSDAEWTTLTDFVGGEDIAGTKLKSTSGWANNGNGTDQYGFSALPGGAGRSDGIFYAGGGNWWSATEYDASDAWDRYMNYDDEGVGRGGHDKAYLFSVRCVQDEAGGIEQYKVTFDSQGGSSVDSQMVASGSKATTPADPTRTGYTFGGWYKETAYNTQWNFGTDVVTSAITLYAQWTPTVTTFKDSRDDKIYREVTIGTQTWMAENLNYDAPDDTTDLCYKNSPDSCAKYGRLYNWSTAKTACPTGWHLPSDAEWGVLVDFVGGTSTAGTKLKSSTGWNSYNGVPVGTDQYGFSALPGGGGNSDGYFNDAGNYGSWWSATGFGASYALFRYMGYYYESVGRNDDGKTYLYSVRCLQD